MTVEVWHRERLAEDSLLGRAHVPLSPLLQESWVDGRAGVFCMLPAADGGDGQQEQERVQVCGACFLRVMFCGMLGESIKRGKCY